MPQLITHDQAADLRDHLTDAAYYADSATEQVVLELRHDLDLAVQDAGAAQFVLVAGELDDHLFAAGIKGLPYDED